MRIMSLLYNNFSKNVKKFKCPIFCPDYNQYEKSTSIVTTSIEIPIKTHPNWEKMCFFMKVTLSVLKNFSKK